jgi:hypothetical protein
MKKFLMVIVFGIISSILFAASVDNYLVQAVSGKVEREVAPDKWEEVKAGDILTISTVIKTGLNSNLVLKSVDRLFSIKALKRGTIETLVKSEVTSGVRISGKVYETDTSVVSRRTSNISTASSRASDVNNDYVWEE